MTSLCNLFKYLGLSATLLRRFTSSESLAWSPPWSRAWTFRPTTTRASPSGWTTLSSSSPRWPFAKRRNATAVLTRGMIFISYQVFWLHMMRFWFLWRHMISGVWCWVRVYLYLCNVTTCVDICFLFYNFLEMRKNSLSAVWKWPCSPLGTKGNQLTSLQSRLWSWS